MNNSCKINISLDLDFSDIPQMIPANQEDLFIVMQSLREWFRDWQLLYYQRICEETARGDERSLVITKIRLNLVEQILNNFVVDGTFENGEKYHYESNSSCHYEKLIIGDKLVRHIDKDGIYIEE